MDTFFVIVFLLSLVALIIGTLKPRLLRLHSSKRVWQIFGSAAVISFTLLAATIPSKPETTSTTKTLTPIADNTDLTTEDIYTTVAGQTAYPLKNRYTGDFYIELDGKQQAFADDGKVDPKQYQALYNDAGPLVRLTSDLGSGHVLKVYESFVPVLPASQVAADYEANEIAADVKYKDKTIKILGTVGTIGKDVLDTPYVTFRADNPYAIVGIVQCMFDTSAESQLANIKKGQSITLKGRVQGKVANILIRDCSIID